MNWKIIKEYYEEEQNRDKIEKERNKEEYCEKIFGSRCEEYIFLTDSILNDFRRENIK